MILINPFEWKGDSDNLEHSYLYDIDGILFASIQDADEDRILQVRDCKFRFIISKSSIEDSLNNIINIINDHIDHTKYKLLTKDEVNYL